MTHSITILRAEPTDALRTGRLAVAATDRTPAEAHTGS
jgi:hypothetical protein